jgi:pyruvate,water dikinase
MDLKTKGFKAFHLNILYKRARQFRFYRDAFTSLFSQSLGLLRKHYLAVAEIWVSEKILPEKELIFYLTKEEVKEIAAEKEKAPAAIAAAIHRKQEMEECRDILLPEIIHGEQAPPVTRQSSKKLVGVASSRGYYQGRIKVVRSINEFEKLEPGDILVIPYSDVSWTPLFAKAGAVIAESGGLLSHSSIIAREYQIPAVVSVNGALQLADGIQVSIDGFKGEILILDGIPA